MNPSKQQREHHDNGPDQSFFDPATFTVTHVVSDPATRAAAIIDNVLDFDPRSGANLRASADQVIAHVEATGLRSNGCSKPTPTDHLSAAPYLQSAWGKIAIGSHIREVQAVFSRVFNLPDMDNGGREFDHLFEDGEHFAIGTRWMCG